MNTSSLKRVISYIGIFIVAFIGIGVWNMWAVTHPTGIDFGRTPDQLGLPHEEITLTTEDGITIAGWFIESEEAESALVLLHGYPAERGDMLLLARDLYPDFSLLLIDMRSFGNSGGTHTTLGTKEVRDLSAGVDFLERRGFEHIGVLGFSLGGAVALSHAADDARIDAVASYAAFANLSDLGVETMPLPDILARPLVFIMSTTGKWFYGIDTANSPERAAADITVPVFLIHSEGDNQIPFSHGERLREALSENQQAEFLFPERGLHGELPPEFGEQLKDFFTRAFSS